MRNIITFFTILIMSLSLSVINAQSISKQATIVPMAGHDTSIELKNITPHIPSGNPEYIENEQEWGEDPFGKNFSQPPANDPVVQSMKGAKGTKGAAINFAGLNNSDNGSILHAPPDTDGDIGPNHYFQTTNTSFEIFDRDGNSLYGPAGVTTIFDGFPGQWTGLKVTDPVVLYDEQADRWFFSTFTKETGSTSGDYYILIAVSQTADPTGSYYRYGYGVSAMPDYAKWAVWPNGYFMGANVHSGYDNFAFDRSQMLLGNGAGGLQVDNGDRPNYSSSFQAVLPADCDGTFPPSSTPAYFVTINDDAWPNNSTDKLMIWEFSVNWSPIGGNWALVQSINTAAFDTYFTGGFHDNIEQPGTTQKLDAITQVLMNRVQYRYIGGQGRIVCNHTVDVSTDHAGIRWYELRKTGSNPWTKYQESTYAPDADNRWMGSIAMNENGDIALGYTVSGSSTYPSIRFTGRNYGDALSLMTIIEQSIQSGANSQTTGSRWGDYSSMRTDPNDGQTFWYTSEYVESSSGWYPWATRIAAFSFNSYCAASGTSCGSSDEYISRVEFGSIDNNTGCDYYTDYSITQINEIPINAAETITVTNGHPWSADQCGIWVDWNNDDDFDDAGETISVSGSAGSGPYTALIDPPGSVSVGDKYTMRVRIVYSTTPSPCGTASFGEVEDYGIEIGSFAYNNTWTGAVSDDWFTPGNWSLGTIPTSDVNVTIPAGTPNDPVIGPGIAYCNNLYLNSGATLTQNEVSYFYCYGTFDAGFGQFTMNGTSYLYFAGSSDTYWWDDYQDDTYTNVRVDKSTSTASVTMKYDMTCSGTFEIREGVFKMDSNRTLTVTNTASGAFEVEDGGKLILDGTKTVDIAGGVKFYNGSQLQMTAGWIKTGGNLWVEANTSYDIHFNAGWLYMTGSGDQYIQDMDGGNLELYSVSIQKPSGTCYITNTDLDINGSLYISSGTLSCRSASGSSTVYDIYIAGNWTNNVGAAGFDEATGRVIFDGGNYHQYCYTDETFNELEVNKPAGGAFRMDGANVVCAAYDWTAGAVDVLSGSFTANDLLDNAIKGAFYNNAGGTINLTNSGSGTYVDLSGELHLFGGTMNVTGSVSWWPFAGDATIEMTGGVLDFTSCGITISNNSYTLTTNITGGVIRTSRGFSGNRADFTPTAGTFEFYGGTDSYLSQSNGCTLYNINIDKSSKSNSVNSGLQTVSDGRVDKTIGDSKDNTISLSSNFVITNNLTVTNGELKLNGHELTVAHICDVYGTLTMDNPTDVLTNGSDYSDRVYFYSGSTGNFTNGVANIYGWIIPYAGCSFTASINNTIYYKGISGGGLSNFEPTATYGNIVIDKNANQITYIDNSATESIVVNGSFTINPNNKFEMQNETMVVHGAFTDNSSSEIYVYNAKKSNGPASGTKESSGQGNTKAKGGSLEIDTDVTLNGLLDVGDGDVLLHGDFQAASTSTITINGGTFIDDAQYFATWNYINGDFNMTDGLFEMTNNSPKFAASTNISGGIIRFGGGFSASAGVFNPTGGEVESIGNISQPNIYCYSPSSIFNLRINSVSGDTLHYLTDVTVTNDLIIDAGNLECDYYFKKTYKGSDLSDKTTAIKQNIGNPNSSNKLPITGGVNKNTKAMDYHLNIGGNWTDNSTGFIPNIGTVTFNGSGDVTIIPGETFYNLTIDKPTTGDWVVPSDDIIVLNDFLVSSGALYTTHTVDVTGNIVVYSILAIQAGGILKVGSGKSLTTYAGSYLALVGSSSNQATLTRSGTGRYGANIYGQIGANYATFEFMNGNGFYLLPGATVNSTYSFNHCIFRNGANSPSALLATNSTDTFTSTDTYFENTSGNTQYNVWKNSSSGNITFEGYSGDFAGPEFEYDPNTQVHWGAVDVDMALTVMLEGPYNGTDMNTDLNNLGLIPLNQPFNSIPSADWYYNGTESVGSIPPNVVDWVLVEIKDATDAASSSGAPVVAVQAAFLLNDGSVVDLDGTSNLDFSGITYSSGLFPVVWHRNHLGVISANRMTKTGGVYTYDFTQSGAAYSDSNAGETNLGGGVWGMFSGDASGGGALNTYDITFWNLNAGLQGYYPGEMNLDSQVDNVDKNDFCVDNFGNESQIPGSKNNDE